MSYKLLLVTRSDINYNSRLHTLFYRKLDKYFDLSVIEASKHNIQISPEKAIEKYNPDVTLCHAHSKHLMGFFKKFKCLKVMVAVDFHKILRRQDFSFYDSNDFDVVFQRGYFESIDMWPMVWLPFSADNSIFNPKWDKWDDRIKQIAFAGSYKGKVYETRRRAINHLRGLLYNTNDNIIDELSHITKTTHYSLFLQKYISYLNGADPMVQYTPYAKIFETIASGGLLFTSFFNGSDVLFPKDSFIEYKEDCSDVVKKHSYIINNIDMMKEMAMKAYSHYFENHTDDKRLHELSNNIINLLQGRHLIRKWGR